MADAPDLSQDRLLAPLPRDRKGLPVIGGCSLVKKLGSGGMGSVYKGVQSKSGRAVAVKILPFTLLEQNPALEKRFLVEARTAAALSSPNVVQVYDVGCEKQTHYIVMEYVSGDSVGGWLRKRRAAGKGGLPEKEVLPVAIAAAAGLAAAHAKGIVHRDVKPDNLLVPEGDPGGTKVADLGLAKPEDGTSTVGTMAHVAMGTPGYMAPEQAEDARSAGPPADVFAMGATLYAMLTGDAPFQGSSLLEILRATAHANPPPLPKEISPALRWVVDCCLAKRPEDRFKDGADLLGALERVVEDPEATGARPAKFARPAPTGSRSLEIASSPSRPRNSLPWIVVVAAAALLSIVTVVLVLKSRGKESEAKPVVAETAPDKSDELLAKAARLTDEGRLEEALAMLDQAPPDDPRVRALRQRVKDRLSAPRDGRKETWRTRADAARADLDRAQGDDTLESWSRAVQSSADLQAFAMSDAENAAAAPLVAEAIQGKRWRIAKDKHGRGDFEGALSEARSALTAGPANDPLESWILKVTAERNERDKKISRKAAFDDSARRAAAETDERKARDLWHEAYLSADDPADAARAQREYDRLCERLEGSEAAKRFEELLRAAATAADQNRFAEADDLVAKAGALRPGDPRVEAATRKITESRAKEAYAAAMAEAAAAAKAGNVAGARSAYRKALEAIPGDRAATDGLKALTPDRTALKVAVKGKLAELTLGDGPGQVMTFVVLKPGVTTIGEGASLRRVTLTKEFAIGVTEVTQAQWGAIFPQNPSRHVGAQFPVETIRWWDAIAFVNAVNERLDGWSVALPSEAQWEYACRAGTKTEWSFGSDAKDLPKYAWTGAEAGGQTHEVAKLAANPWGLHDMHGNVFEWTYDGTAEFPERKDLSDHVSPPTPAHQRIMKGGDVSDPMNTKSGFRQSRVEDDPSPGVGMRLILVQGKNVNPHVAKRTWVLDPARKVDITFALVRAQTFTMGIKGDTGIAQAHNVTISRDYLMQTTETTQAQWVAIMGKRDFHNPGPDNPADNVTWDDAQAFAKKLGERLKVRASLPTEAEWELACRGETSTTWYNGSDANKVSEIAWCAGTKATQPAGKLRPNLFGLHDMSGNVFEWCQDWYEPYAGTDAIDPAGPKDGSERVMRGGCYTDNPGNSASDARARFAPSGRQFNMGFRVVIR